MINIDWIKNIIASWYGLEVTQIYRIRAAWRVETSSGPKCFKQVDEFRTKVNFVASAIQYLIDHGFNYTVPLIKTVFDTYVALPPEGVFYLTDWIPGREGDLTNPEDVRAAAKVLAKLHKASRGFTVPEGLKARETWGDLPADWNFRRRKLEKYKETASQNPLDSFNQLFLEWFDPYLQRSNQAGEILNSCDYPGLVQAAQRDGCLCHKDFTYHNFIIDSQNNLNVIDFDYCALEITAYDLGRFIRIVGKSTEWQLSIVETVLQAYHRELPLNQDEIVFILAFLHFPQRFWRIVDRHFSGIAEKAARNTVRQLTHEINNFVPEENMLNDLAKKVSRGVLLGR